MESEQSSSLSKKSALVRLFRARKRREMLFVQVCFVCSVLLAAWCMSAVLSRSGHGIVLQETPHTGRRLMAMEDDNETEEKNCSDPGNSEHAHRHIFNSSPGTT
ncbi:hypothetical protein MHYP_G00137210 [Metynnis hypsauchen]